MGGRRGRKGRGRGRVKGRENYIYSPQLENSQAALILAVKNAHQRTISHKKYRGHLRGLVYAPLFAIYELLTLLEKPRRGTQHVLSNALCADLL